MYRLAHQHEAALARAFGHRRHARQHAQRVVISALQSIGCFCEQRGGDDLSDARQGSQDRHVALLTRLPRSIIPTGELFCQLVELCFSVLDLLIDECEPLRLRP